MLSWVPGHSGFQRNEKADDLIRKGFEERPLAPDVHCGISSPTAKRELKTRCERIHKRAWIFTCRQCQSQCPCFRLERKYYLFGLSSLLTNFFRVLGWLGGFLWLSDFAGCIVLFLPRSDLKSLKSQRRWPESMVLSAVCKCGGLGNNLCKL